MPQTVSSASTVKKALDLLDCFSIDRPQLSVREFAGLSGLPRPTVHRLLTALRAKGYVTQDPVTRRYRFGYRILELAQLAGKTAWPTEVALPMMTRLRDATGEAVYLLVADQSEGVVLAQVEPAEGVRMWTRVGSRRPLHVGASMKAILASRPEAEVKAYIAEHGLVAVGPGTITDPQRLLADLERIRACGYAISVEEYKAGGLGIAAPIRDRSGTLVAAITLGMAKSTVDEQRLQELISLVVATADEISRALGYAGTAPKVPAVR